MIRWSRPWLLLSFACFPFVIESQPARGNTAVIAKIQTLSQHRPFNSHFVINPYFSLCVSIWEHTVFLHFYSYARLIVSSSVERFLCFFFLCFLNMHVGTKRRFSHLWYPFFLFSSFFPNICAFFICSSSSVNSTFLQQIPLLVSHSSEGSYSVFTLLSLQLFLSSFSSLSIL